MPALFLAPEELVELTGRKRGKEQREALDTMGIRWKVNAAGETLVGRRHVEEVFCGAEAQTSSDRKKPNLEALDRKAS
ncbi:DUF4224 domain-containing protein [Salinicola sp. DM10]|uniref:DUF4224 domain-containing protein n=1 Tax=Salinicola sp. DM10 TaxID=2815721 RepID=UPI001A8CC25A|nr:DUF4224 domain-containing protein [Salinicola sp. DM10]MCE3025773.1 DUF4224 domain-containing protein [Salinicola sp. DM10]